MTVALGIVTAILVIGIVVVIQHCRDVRKSHDSDGSTEGITDGITEGKRIKKLAGSAA